MKEIFYNKFKLLTTLSQINMYHEENQPIEENRELHEKYKEIQTVYNILTETGFEYKEEDEFLDDWIKW